MTTMNTTSTEQQEEAVKAPSHDAIATRAYDLYALRGRVEGYDVEDWLAAEAELLAEQSEHR